MNSNGFRISNQPFRDGQIGETIFEEDRQTLDER